ncbi:uncharacterized protein LOC133712565 isoform X2 [Rosa rugosa]|uniref:uncharacterized protein LOC133712565 isoform X2 n=1 Tax=Rosa rugosa TaxID=74645 RepID=UPI002B40F845|nr:uncharacterized protein LOC133712565 isoform X2 [Rosa rugosa]
MSAFINSVTKAVDRDDMLCDDTVSHLNSSSPGCRGSNESWNRRVRLSTYRRRGECSVQFLMKSFLQLKIGDLEVDYEAEEIASIVHTTLAVDKERC